MVVGLLGAAPVAAQGVQQAAPLTPAAASDGAVAPVAEGVSAPPAEPAPTAHVAPPTTAVVTGAGQPVYPPAGSPRFVAGRGVDGKESRASAYEPRRRREYDGPPLLLGRRIAVGGYGGFGAAFTQMLDRNGAAVGFEGALLLAHRLSLGFAGYGFSRTPNGPAALDGTERKLGAGYGGFVARYAFLTNLPVYFSVGMIVGGGAVVLHDDEERDEWDGRHDDRDVSDGFFVVQPELAMHANLTRWMRVGLTGGYRVTSNVSRFGLSESDLNGVVLGGNIQFGWI